MSLSKMYQRIVWKNYPNIETPLNASNMNIMDYSINELDNRVVALDTTKANQSDLNQCVKSLDFDPQSGIFTINYVNGTKSVIDTLLEKVIINFDYDKTTQTLILYAEDGTQQRIDLSNLVAQYEFDNTDFISFSVDSNGHIKADIIDGSITTDKLEPNFLHT